jgi:glycogen operon protein
MGDEVRHTQRGNNNAYCQDNEISWFDWTRVSKYADVHRFMTLLAERRLLRGVEHEHQRMSLNQLLRQAKITWHGVKLGQPDWSSSSRSVACTVEMRREKMLLHLILNPFWEPLGFELPQPGNEDGNTWRRWIDTTLDSPEDIVSWQKAPSIPGLSYRVGPRSVVVLFSGL